MRRPLCRLGAWQRELVLRLRSERLVGGLTRTVGLADGRTAPERGLTRAMDADTVLQLLAIKPAGTCSE